MAQDQKVSTTALLMVAIAPMCWAGNIVLAKGVTSLIPPVALAFWRWTIAFCILFPFSFPYVKKDWKAALAGWKIIVLLSLFGISGFNTLLYKAMHTTTAINGALIQTTMPAVIILITLILYKEWVSLAQVTGVCFCIAGAGVVILKGRWQALVELSMVQGDLLMILAVILYALYSALLPKRPAIHPVSFLVFTFGLGSLCLLPIYLWEIRAVGGFSVTPAIFGSIGYVAIFPSIVAYFCWNRGVADIGANRTGLFINLIPVFAAALAVSFLGESLQVFHFVGMALILLGFILFNR